MTLFLAFCLMGFLGVVIGGAYEKRRWEQKEEIYVAAISELCDDLARLHAEREINAATQPVVVIREQPRHFAC